MPKILIVDDDSAVLMSLEQALKSAGHEVVPAVNGMEAMNKQLAAPADLVIIDLFMPEQEGLETITELRLKFPGIPIIAISGGHMTSGAMLSVAQRLGAD